MSNLTRVEVRVIPGGGLAAALDAAVRRGGMTGDDARELLAEIVRRAIQAPAEGFIKRVTGEDGEFPIAGYDDLTAAQIVSHLGELEAPQLRRVRDYERRNANRKTVLAAVDQKLS